MRNSPVIAARRAQRGLSPVELLVALVLGLGLMAGIGQLAVASRQTSRAEQSAQELQEVGRYAIEVVGRELRKTGYRIERVLTVEAVFPNALPFTAAGAVVTGTSGLVTMRYQGSGDAWTRTCLGQDVAAGVTVVQSLWVADGELRCRAQNLSTGTDQSEPLLSRVEAMSITYGVDTDGDQYADNYLAAGAVSDWRQVVSLNVQLRMASGDDFVADRSLPYVAFDGSVTTPSDRRLRRAYATVVALRNVIP